TGASLDSFALVWDTDHYAIAFSDLAVGGGDVYSVFVDVAGAPRGAPGAGQPTAAAAGVPDLRATDAGYVVAWEEGTAGQAVYAHALDKSGGPTGNGATIAATGAPQARPVLSVVPGGLAIAWMDVMLGINASDFALTDGALVARGT